MPAIGEVWRHQRFYFDHDENRWKTKFLMVLGLLQGGDVVVRALTSRENLRDNHQCSHDRIRPGFHVGIIDPTVGLNRDTWPSLRSADDIDGDTWAALVRNQTLVFTCTIPAQIMCPLLLCAIGADDTLRLQRDAMYVARAVLGC